MFESANEFILSAIVALSGGVVAVLTGNWLGRRVLPVLLLYVWHTTLGFFFSNYVLINGGDAWGYYQQARFDLVELNVGTDFIAWFTSIPVSLGFTYWPISFLYNAMGAIGLIFFYAALTQLVRNDGPCRFLHIVMWVCLFIPSLSFWTSGIGKDAPALLAVGIFLWSALAFDKRQIGAVVAGLIMLAVRPHIAVLMVLSVAAGTMFVKDLRGSVRFGMGALATAAAIFVIPLALLYSGTTKFSSIGDYVSSRQEANLGGGSSIDITDMNPVIRLLSYLYRPLPNEALGFDQLAASIDNLIIIALTAVGLFAIFRAGPVRIFRTYSIPMLYGTACLVLLSQVTANLGLAMRQKWMLVPALMLVFAGSWSAMKDKTEARRRQFRLPGAPQAAR